jgi:hypothetical protein
LYLYMYVMYKDYVFMYAGSLYKSQQPHPFLPFRLEFGKNHLMKSLQY